MPWQAVAAGASATGNIISQYMANQNNIQLQEMADAHNSQLAQEQRQWDYEMWLKQNEYNDPRAQMERLRAAGINPALAYSNGGLQNEAAPAVPAAGSRDQAAHVTPYQVDPLLMAQVANLNAQTEKTDAEKQSILETLPEQIKAMQQQSEESKAKVAEMNQNVLNMQELIKNMTEERKLTVQKQITESFNRTMASQHFEQECKESTARINKMCQDILESKSKEALNYEERKAVIAGTKLSEQAYAYNAAANVYKLLGLQLDNDLKEKSKTLYDDQHALNVLQKELLGFEVSSGQIQARRDEKWMNLLTGKGGSALQAAAGAVDGLVGACNMLLTPVRGIISIK